MLAKVGGFEIAGLAGAILAAAANGRPVVVDGFISTAAAMIAVGLAPQVRDYLFAAHHSMERGHEIMLEWLQLEPLLDLDLRLGEGTGGALAMSLSILDQAGGIGQDPQRDGDVCRCGGVRAGGVGKILVTDRHR